MESDFPLELSPPSEDPPTVKGMEPTNMDKTFMPQVSIEDSTPSVGKTFKTADDAYVFYNNYAKAAGFSKRKANCNKNKAGEYRMRIFTCSREGKIDEKCQEKEKHTQPRTCERNRGHMVACVKLARFGNRRMQMGGLLVRSWLSTPILFLPQEKFTYFL